MKWLLVAIVLVFLVLHQDTWNWTNKTLVFGFIPIGLAYHILYSGMAAVVMWCLVTFAWPGHLEEEAAHAKGEDA